ncbi:DUF4258 domain-containing protein [Myroides indicus]|uniref:DUF4258 domain-containing protein n=1 Tax=Myroides indicus TaxID=1323422 RepID=A0A4V3E934_9FLAO|nr:DUF4258 domain-containing protein [Myroides indicus]TDS64171.1 hypothetical protein C8P70_10520 [Myroides indicus]
MKFSQRLAYYLFGLLIGCIFLLYFFGEKKTEFCYLPNCRVLKELRTKPMTYSPEADSILQQNWVEKKDIEKILQHGKVDFSKSNIEFENGKIYIINGINKKNESITIKVINYSNDSKLYDIVKNNAFP